MISEEQKVLDNLYKEIRHACNTCSAPDHLSKNELELILGILKGYMNTEVLLTDYDLKTWS